MHRPAAQVPAPPYLLCKLMAGEEQHSLATSACIVACSLSLALEELLHFIGEVAPTSACIVTCSLALTI